MTTILTTTLFYITYPFVLLFSLILIIAAPLVHLAHYVIYGLWGWPLGVLAKFEVIYPTISSPFPPPPCSKNQNQRHTDAVHLLRGRDPGRRARGHELAFHLRLLVRCPQSRIPASLVPFIRILRAAAAAAAAATTSPDVGRGSRGAKKGGGTGRDEKWSSEAEREGAQRGVE